MANRKFSFVHLDVFTSRRLEGNQLAVFTDARGLSDEEMQKLAREMNLAETTFILPRDEAIERAEGHKVRIFTVNEELPFAGHPTLGTAWYLKQHSNQNEIVLDLKVGKIPVRFEQRDGLLVWRDAPGRPAIRRDAAARHRSRRAWPAHQRTGRKPAHPDGVHGHAVHDRSLP